MPAWGPFIRFMLKYGVPMTANEIANYALADVIDVPNTFGVRKLQVVFSRVSGPTGSEIPEDVAVNTFHFVNITDGNPDDTWVDADFTAVETAYDTFWTTAKAHCWSGTKLAQYRWYKTRKGTAETGPATRIVNRAVAGTGTAQLPPQCAMSVTERTALRKHWGRFYLPSPAQLTCATEGYIKPTVTTALADAAATFYTSCASAGLQPVVWSPTREIAYGVEKIQVDDLFDVIRSRRYDLPKTKQLRPV